MLYLFMLAMIASGYYTFTFGVNQWNKKNKLGGISTMVVAVLGTIVPSIVLYLKNA
ncbi:MAG: YczI family protein [Clostridia bacterium]|nr:YczI family protein [Clostridia bacterium]